MRKYIGHVVVVVVVVVVDMAFCKRKSWQQLDNPGEMGQLCVAMLLPGLTR